MFLTCRRLFGPLPASYSTSAPAIKVVPPPIPRLSPGYEAVCSSEAADADPLVAQRLPVISSCLPTFWMLVAPIWGSSPNLLTRACRWPFATVSLARPGSFCPCKRPCLPSVLRNFDCPCLSELDCPRCYRQRMKTDDSPILS